MNVDFPDPWCKKKPDIECDIRKLPFDDHSADEIHAIHVIEHFYLWEVGDILKDWHRVLKPDGLLVLECPDLEKVLYWFNQGEVDPKMTFWALYGDPKYGRPEMCHKWAYTHDMLGGVISDAGFHSIIVDEPKYHVKARDMRLEAHA